MANLIVRNIDEKIVEALKAQAAKNGLSAEAEYRRILESVLLKPKKKSFAEALKSIPNVGNDDDFERLEDSGDANVFD
ncbi:DNA-binding protein [Endozoicomonas sp. ONNA2]|uniref:FitA-like ribbon-helix-helix domain-containing protein n=1 Tax=Endozoicomonas sp. ONNA2 TaxID=2828741 RepID=UPI002147609A